MMTTLPKVKDNEITDDVKAFAEIATRLKGFTEEERQKILASLYKFFSFTAGRN